MYILRVCIIPLVSLAVAALAAAVASGAEENDTLAYSEDFESGAAEGWWLNPGWEIQPVEDGFGLRGDGQGHAHSGYEGAVWTDSLLRCRILLEGDMAHVSYRDAGESRYFLTLSASDIILNKQTDPDTFVNDLASGPGISYGQWHTLLIDGTAGTLTVSIDGAEILAYTDPDPLLAGGISFESFEAPFWLDDVEVLIPAALAPPPGLIWVGTGGPLGGLGYDIRMHPDNREILYVTDAFSGLFKSTNGGTRWYPVNEGITSRAGGSGDAIPIFCLTLDPHDPQTLWIGTQNQRGIFQSTDGGNSWTQKDNGVVEDSGITFRGVAVDPTTDQIVYAAAEVSSWAWAGEERPGREFDLTQGVVYKSTDGGGNWEVIWRGDNLARYIWIDPRDTDVLYVSTGIFDREAANSDPVAGLPGGVGVIKSTDGGRSFTEINSGLDNLFVGSLFMHPENPDILLAGTGNNQYFEGAGVYLTTNAGASWQRTLSGVMITSVEFARSNPAIAYAGGPDAIYRSEDGALTWRMVSGGGQDGWGAPGVRAGFPIDFMVDPTDPDRIFVNNYGGGNFLSTDGGASWTVASQGYTGAQVRDVVVDPSAAGRVFAAARSGIFVSYDGGDEWIGLSNPPQVVMEWYVVALDPMDPQHVLAANNWTGVIVESHDSGQSWRTAGPFLGEGVSWRAIAFAPSAPATVYAGTSAYFSAGTFGESLPAAGIYASYDSGASWTPINDATSSDANVTALAVDRDDPQTVYAATGNHGILKTTNGGRSWEAANEGLPTSPTALAVVVHPAEPQTLYCGLDSAGMYRSEDGGATWEQWAAGMSAQARVSDIIFDPTDPQTMYAADRSTGVYRSTGGRATWVQIASGLRTRDVNSLAISDDGAHVYAGTEGGGVFRLDVLGTPPPASQAPDSGDANETDETSVDADDSPIDDEDADVVPDGNATDGSEVVDDGTDASTDPDDDGSVDDTVTDNGGGGDRGGSGCGAGAMILLIWVPFALFLRAYPRR